MNPGQFSPSLQLLIILCKPEWSDADIMFIKHQSSDELSVLQCSERHRVTPLLWAALQKTNLFAEETRGLIRQSVQLNQLKALQTKALQSELTSLMERLSVPGFFLKGSGIAERFYDDIAERHVLDIDLYVGEKGLWEMAKALVQMGYQSSPNIFSFNASQRWFFKKTHHDIYFSSPHHVQLNPIELHWSLRGPMGGFNLVPAKPMNDIDEFLYLCVHGTEHGWFRLKWLMDLPRITMNSHFDWLDVRRRAIELNCRKHLDITLLVLDSLSIIPMPKSLIGVIHSSDYIFQLTYIFHAISSEKTFNEDDRNRWQYFRYLWSLSPKIWNPNFFLLFLTSPNDWAILRLPNALFFLYIPLRPFLWIYRRLHK